MSISDDWRDIIRRWAEASEEVAGVTAYGSRVTGVRREKANRRPVPDLDLAIETISDDRGTPLGHFMVLAPRWAALLSDQLGVDVDLRHHLPSDPEDDVAPYLARGCERIWP